MMNFGQAIEKLKAGKQVAREGWNGKGMHLELKEGNPLELLRDHIVMKTVDGTRVPWVASQTDILAEDWVLVGDIHKREDFEVSDFTGDKVIIKHGEKYGLFIDVEKSGEPPFFGTKGEVEELIEKLTIAQSQMINEEDSE